MVTVDVSGVTDQAAFWDCYVRTAKPQEAGLFGRNLDAFWDAVEGGGPGNPGSVDLHFVGMNVVRSWPNGQAFLDAFVDIAARARLTAITWED